MPARGYSSLDAVVTQLGRPLTVAEQSAAAALFEPAEAWIEDRAGRAWPVAAITDEAYYQLQGPYLYLKTTPILSVQSVKARAGLTATETTLTVNTDYEVRDLAAGLIYIPAQGGAASGDVVLAGGAEHGLGLPYDRIRVSYTPAATVPARVKLATTLLVIHWLAPQVSGLMPGAQSVSVGGELTVSATKAAAEFGVPAEVLTLVRPRFGFA